MKFQLCFCFKRNRASYNLSSEQISYRNAAPKTAIVTSQPVSSSSSDSPIKPNDTNVLELSNDRQLETDNEHLTRSTSMHVTFRQLPPVTCEDDGELYATVDKTKIAKNAIRIRPDTHFPSSVTT